MKYEERRGNLFELPKEYVLCQCISEDCAMGAGIAVEFQNKFHMKYRIRNYLQDNNMHYPCIVPFDEDRRVINLVTKKFYYNKPTYKSLEIVLDQLHEYCMNKYIKNLAMPRIGCGLDRLSWPVIRHMIQDKFSDLNITIQVRYL